MVQRENAAPPLIRHAKEFNEAHYTEEHSLTQAAKAGNTSTFYFCKLFKPATGITFTHYLLRVRNEQARTLLRNPNLRISEVTLEVGFQSLTHFNRLFRKFVG